MSGRTLGHLQERCRIYEEGTDIDLLYPVIVSLSKKMAEMTKLDFSLKRMDSLSCIQHQKMSHLELLYTCVANLPKKPKKWVETAGTFEALYAGR